MAKVTDHHAAKPKLENVRSALALSHILLLDMTMSPTQQQRRPPATGREGSEQKASY